MNGYAKIRFISTKKSRSMDFSDLSSSLQETQKTLPNPNSKPQETKQMKSTNTTNDSISEQEDEAGNGERSVKMLRRNYSVSSSSSHGFRFDKQSTGLQSAVKRAFSMKRSSSVSERYCRIHDQSVTLASSPPIDDEADMDTMQTTRSVKKKEKRGKILKACKRLFGL